VECLLGALVCAVDEEEFDSGLLDSLVVPFAETELHGPLCDDTEFVTLGDRNRGVTVLTVFSVERDFHRK